MVFCICCFLEGDAERFKKAYYKKLGSLAQHGRLRHPGVAVRTLACDAEGVAIDLAQNCLPQILYEDEQMVIVIKPAGVDTHVFMHAEGMTMLGGSVSYEDALSGPQAVHRLDNATSGCLVFAKTQSASRALSMAFEARLVRKRYRAVVAGAVECDEGVIDAPISGKASQTRYVVARRDPSRTHGVVTTLDLWPATGRRHQLRRHLAERLNTPIVGDPLYRTNTSLKRAPLPTDDAAGPLPPPPQMLLWAAALDLPHPLKVGVAVSVSAEEPPYFEAYRSSELAVSGAAMAASLAV